MVRKLLLLLLSSFLWCGQAAALLDKDTVFYFWPNAASNMVGGGGFNSTNAAPGTDYSNQQNPQYSFCATGCTYTNNLVIGNPDTTTISSASYSFATTDRGNIINITAGTGFTIGRYEIVSVSAGIATLDRAVGTAGSTGGSGYVGGALSLNSTLDDDFFEEISGANAEDGIRVCFKTGSYTLGEAVSIAGAGGTQAPIVVKGYTTTCGDVTTGSNRPNISGGANQWNSGSNFDYYNLIFTGTAATMFTIGVDSKAVNCKFSNTSSTINRDALGTGATVLIWNSEAISYWGRALNLGSTTGKLVVGSYFHDSDVGIESSATGTGTHTILNTIIADNVTTGFSSTAASSSGTTINNSTFYGAENKLGTGLSFATGTDVVRLTNSIIYGFVTGVSHANAGQTVSFDDYNAYNNNTTDVTNWTKGANDSTLAPSFTNVTQVTGTTGAFVAGGSKLVDTSKNFTTLGVGAGEIVYITGGTGTTASTRKKYLIDSISTTTNPNDTLNITVPASPGTDTTADKTYQITLGHNFAIGTNLKALGFPGAFPGASTTGYLDIGATQRQEPAGGGSGYSRGRVINQ